MLDMWEDAGCANGRRQGQSQKSCLKPSSFRNMHVQDVGGGVHSTAEQKRASVLWVQWGFDWS